MKVNVKILIRTIKSIYDFIFSRFWSALTFYLVLTSFCIYLITPESARLEFLDDLSYDVFVKDVHRKVMQQNVLGTTLEVAYSDVEFEEVVRKKREEIKNFSLEPTGNKQNDLDQARQKELELRQRIMVNKANLYVCTLYEEKSGAGARDLEDETYLFWKRMGYKFKNLEGCLYVYNAKVLNAIHLQRYCCEGK